MGSIEWHESKELEPEWGSLQAFCRELGLAESAVPRKNELQVFIDRSALEALHDFLAHDLRREHGGVLVGKPYYDPEYQCCFVQIQSAIPAQETEGSPVHLQFTPEAWATISGIIEENYPEQVVVGWYHSHPALGVFMSGTDRATHQAFYAHPWSVAVVADPVAQQTGWFAGKDCEALKPEQVVVYRMRRQKQPARAEKQDELARLEQEYRSRQEGQPWRWLLPFGLVLAVGLALTWQLTRKANRRREARLD